MTPRAAIALLAVACARPAPPVATTLRVATFNTSLNREVRGGLARDLGAGSEQARGVAALLQAVRPDVVLLQEVDHDPLALDLLVDRYLAVGQDGAEGLDYPYRYTAEVNTGEPSGLDLDGDGRSDHPQGSAGYASDAWGFGRFPGQYGMAVLSRFPLDEVRTFRLLRWVELPGAEPPDGFYPPGVLERLRLSSKSHWDVVVRVGGGLHLLAAHPTPPVFDGPEDRNGRRNADELALWARYLDGLPLRDDDGRTAALDGRPFVLLGDLNNDPYDGDGHHAAIRALLDHPRVAPTAAPTSGGALEAAMRQGGVNPSHAGPPSADTIDIDDAVVGNLRLDYVLPSAGLVVGGRGVLWPRPGEPLYEAVGEHPFPVSDHRLVWVDVAVP